MTRTMQSLVAVVLVAAGLGAGFVAASARRAEPLPGELTIVDEPLHLVRKSNEELLVTPLHWLEMPMLRRDFDLVADLELAEGAECDLLLRRVEPRPLHGVALGFHSRFAALRLSTVADGEPWRTPEQALFGPGGGVRLAGGMLATVQIRARGRTLEATVAGKRLPPFDCADEHGSFVLLARGGSVAVRSLAITPVALATPWHPAWWGAAIGLALALLGWRRRAEAWRSCAAAGVLLGGAWLVRDVVLATLPPLAQPEAVGELQAVVAGSILALGLLLRGFAGIVVAGAGAGFAAALVVAGLGRIDARFPPTPLLDEYFGPASRDDVTQTLGGRVRHPKGVNTPEPAAHRVFLLGGQLLWQRGADPDSHVALQLRGELLKAGAATDADVVVAPTVDGWSLQQWRLFDRFYRVYRPRVVVFGVPRDEAAVDDRTGAPRSSPEQLRQAVAAARAGCKELGADLVLVADAQLPPELMAVLRDVAAEGVPLVELSANDAAEGIARKVAAAVTPFVRA